MFEPSSLALGGLIVLAAGLVQGLLGFGFALVAVPVLALVMVPREAVPVALVLGTFINLFLYLEVRGRVQAGRLLPLVLAGIAGIPVGTYLLVSLNTGILRIAIGCLVALSALAFLAGLERPIKRERIGLAASGFTSGILNGVASMSGPPVVLFLANQGMPKDAFRASLIAYFLVLNLATVPVYIVARLVSVDVLAYAGVLLPLMAAGALAGSRLARRVPEKAFRRAVLVAVAAAGVVAVVSGIRLV